jgi:hypothetical protein
MMFEPGNFTAPELEYRGVKCEDISSLEVVGDNCMVEAYEFGDFNQEHSGWTATFRSGKHDAAQFAPAGAKNDDISSFKVIRLPQEGEVAQESPSAAPQMKDFLPKGFGGQ